MKISIKQLYCTMILLIVVNHGFSADFNLYDSGSTGIIDYHKYGEFINIGANGFHYKIKDYLELSKVSGEGVYPYHISVSSSKRFRELLEKKELSGNIWDYLDKKDKEKAFYKWASSIEDPGVKQFFIGSILHKSGNLNQAIKAYYSTIIFFNRSVCWSEDGSYVWYVAQAAHNEIVNICRMHPELGYQLKDAFVDVVNGFDTDLGNDIIKVNPGKFVRNTQNNIIIPGDVVERRGEGLVSLRKYANGHWQLFLEDSPYFIKAVNYMPTRIGESPMSRESTFWMWEDLNGNDKIDVAYDSWIDHNKNNKQDLDEISEGDFSIMKKMGINSIKFYTGKTKSGYKQGEVNKKLLRDMANRWGIKVIMGDFFGAYTIGSNADWSKGTDYSNPVERKNMLGSVRRMVEDNKDEPYILMWVLGNENDIDINYNGVNATKTNASLIPEDYISLIEEAASMIHKIDPDHPVLVGSLTLNHLKLFKRLAPSLDIFGLNIYRENGFGNTWQKIQRFLDKPVLITEYGSDAYFNNQGVRDDLQLEIIKNCMNDIEFNSYGNNGVGNAVGGILFEWVDEWWKDTHFGDSYNNHQTKAQHRFSTFDGWGHEEWFGLFGQGDGLHSPFLRDPRKIFYYLKKKTNLKYKS